MIRMIHGTRVRRGLGLLALSHPITALGSVYATTFFDRASFRTLVTQNLEECLSHVRYHSLDTFESNLRGSTGLVLPLVASRVHDLHCAMYIRIRVSVFGKSHAQRMHSSKIRKNVPRELKHLAKPESLNILENGRYLTLHSPKSPLSLS